MNRFLGSSLFYLFSSDDFWFLCYLNIKVESTCVSTSNNHSPYYNSHF